MRQLRRRMREAAADWTWLAACMGVVEGDMNPVEAYLNGGGDPTRKLANPEVGSLKSDPINNMRRQRKGNKISNIITFQYPSSS